MSCSPAEMSQISGKAKCSFTPTKARLLLKIVWNAHSGVFWFLYLSLPEPKKEAKLLVGGVIFEQHLSFPARSEFQKQDLCGIYLTQVIPTVYLWEVTFSSVQIQISLLIMNCLWKQHSKKKQFYIFHPWNSVWKSVPTTVASVLTKQSQGSNVYQYDSD